MTEGRLQVLIQGLRGSQVLYQIPGEWFEAYPISAKKLGFYLIFSKNSKTRKYEETEATEYNGKNIPTASRWITYPTHHTTLTSLPKLRLLVHITLKNLNFANLVIFGVVHGF